MKWRTCEIIPSLNSSIWVSGFVFPGVKRLGRGADHSLPSSTKVKSAWSYNSTSSLCLHGVVLNETMDISSPVSMAVRSKASTVFGRSNIGIAGSNPARGMDVCLCFSVLCCPV
jgi:hypothetical protein